MKITGNVWQKFVLVGAIWGMIFEAIRDKSINFSFANLMSCILSGLVLGSIVY